jgi:hypothetical protein
MDARTRFAEAADRAWSWSIDTFNQELGEDPFLACGVAYDTATLQEAQERAGLVKGAE